MVMDMTGIQVANASLLDEGTAAAEAMTMVYGIVNKNLDGLPGIDFSSRKNVLPKPLMLLKRGHNLSVSMLSWATTKR